MFEILTIIISLWIFIKAVKLALKITWGLAKIIATVLLVLFVPVLFVCIFFIGSFTLFLPVITAAAAFIILKKCI